MILGYITKLQVLDLSNSDALNEILSFGNEKCAEFVDETSLISPYRKRFNRLMANLIVLFNRMRNGSQKNRFFDSVIEVACREYVKAFGGEAEFVDEFLEFEDAFICM